MTSPMTAARTSRSSREERDSCQFPARKSSSECPFDDPGVVYRRGVDDSRERADLRKAGILIAITGALYVSGLLGRGASIDPNTDPMGFAQFISSTRGIVSAAITIAGMGFHIIGVIVAARGLAQVNPRAVSLSVILTVASLVLTIAIIGPFVYTWPAITRAYLEGNTRALEIVKLSVGPLFIGSVLAEGALSTLAGVLLAMILRRANLPSWICWAYGLAAPLYATPIPGVYAEITGSALLLASGIGLARTPQLVGDSAARA